MITEDHQGVGTSATGYAGPKFGPFKCGHCEYFRPGQSGCVNPLVIKDPEVPGDGKMAHVNIGGCCNKYEPKGRD